ncbi:hypothetical protein LSTR_LSTR011485, partial [Laodelphax striatellus]
MDFNCCSRDRSFSFSVASTDESQSKQCSGRIEYCIYFEALEAMERELQHKALREELKSRSAQMESVHTTADELVRKAPADAQTFRNQQQQQHLVRPSMCSLEKLVARYRLNTLVVKMFPEEMGYSISFRRNGDFKLVETTRLPYTEDEILGYIDNEELPPILTDRLEQKYSNLFYSGTVIVQLQDFRHTNNSHCDRYVLLRPSTQSLINDVNLLTAKYKWSAHKAKLAESQLVLATQGPLCLDPTPALGMAVARLRHQPLHTADIRACAKRTSTMAALSRKRKLADMETSQLASWLKRRGGRQRRGAMLAVARAAAAAAANRKKVASMEMCTLQILYKDTLLEAEGLLIVSTSWDSSVIIPGYASYIANVMEPGELLIAVRLEGKPHDLFKK